MTVVSLSTQLVPHTTAKAGDVMSDLVVLANALNGGIDRDNVNHLSGPLSSPVSNSGDAGTGIALALADHQHVVQGLENLTTDPATGNEVGREYFNTVTKKTRLCIDAAGAGLWVTTGNYDATDLPDHAANHASGGSDELPDHAITQHMLASRTIYTGTISGDVVIPSGTWTDLCSMTISTTGIQLVLVTIDVGVNNGNGSGQPGISLRVRDHTNSDTTIYHSPARQAVGKDTSEADEFLLSPSFFYVTPSDGSRRLDLQMGSNLSGITAKKPFTGTPSESLLRNTIEAVVL